MSHQKGPGPCDKVYEQLAKYLQLRNVIELRGKDAGLGRSFCGQGGGREEIPKTKTCHLT